MRKCHPCGQTSPHNSPKHGALAGSYRPRYQFNPQSSIGNAGAKGDQATLLEANQAWASLLLGPELFVNSGLREKSAWQQSHRLLGCHYPLVFEWEILQISMGSMRSMNLHLQVSHWLHMYIYIISPNTHMYIYIYVHISISFFFSLSLSLSPCP